MYDCVILDCHGFITHHVHRAYAAFFQAWLSQTGLRPHKSVTLLILDRPENQSVGDRAQEIAIRTGLDTVKAAQISRATKRYYSEVYVPNHDVKNTVKLISEMGVKLVVLTNGELVQVEPLMTKWKLSPLLMGVFGRENTVDSRSRSPKPNIDVQKEILDPLGITLKVPSRALLVGDHWVDVVTAKNNGMHSALLITASTQIMPKQVTIAKAVYTKPIIVPDIILLEPNELVSAIKGYDLDYANRLKIFTTTGLSTRTTKIWG